MSSMKILYSSRFLRRYKRLSLAVKLSAERRETLFRVDWKSSVLDTHKLKGRLAGLWAFSVTDRYRIIFEFVGEDTVLFQTIGDHSVYD